MGETVIQGDVPVVRSGSDFAAGLRKLRVERGQILIQTAQRAGLSLRYINRMEREFAGSGDPGRKVNPTLDTLMGLSKALNVAFVIDGRGGGGSDG